MLILKRIGQLSLHLKLGCVDIQWQIVAIGKRSLSTCAQNLLNSAANTERKRVNTKQIKIYSNYGLFHKWGMLEWVDRKYKMHIKTYFAICCSNDLPTKSSFAIKSVMKTTRIRDIANVQFSMNFDNTIMVTIPILCDLAMRNKKELWRLKQ